MNPENNDFRLRAGSPGLDEGAPVDLNIDYEGNPRPVDFPTLGANGIGHGYDIGAYERPLNGYYEDRFLPFNNPNSDIDGDGKVDLIDLQILLEDWGRVSGASNR